MPQRHVKGLRALRGALALFWIIGGLSWSAGPLTWSRLPAYHFVTLWVPGRAWGYALVVIGLVQLSSVGCGDGLCQTTLVLGLATALTFAVGTFFAVISGLMSGLFGPALFLVLAAVQTFVLVNPPPEVP